jgi:hypothetical protein
MVANFGQYTFAAGDVIIVIKIKVVTYLGIADILDALEKAIQWIKNHIDLFKKPTPPDPVQGEVVLHNADKSWVPADEVIGSVWHVLWPEEEYCRYDTVTSYIPNGNAVLDSCDTLDFDGNDEEKWHVVWIGPTIEVREIRYDDEDTLKVYLEYMGNEYADMSPITDEDVIGTYWHEIRPHYCDKYKVVDIIPNGNGYLDSCDIIILRNTDTFKRKVVHVIGVYTDIIINKISTDCCNVPGDANSTETVNILDVTYIINYLYKGGPPPECLNEGDVNETCTINILDVTFLINYLYKGGPPPTCGCVE